MRRPYIFLADLLYAIEDLAVRDAAVARLVLQMLSLEQLEAGPAVTREGVYASQPAARRATEPRPIISEPPVTPEAPPTPDQLAARPPGLRKLPTAPVSRTPPAWLGEAITMPQPTGPIPPPALFAPLFPAGQTRGLLTAALASRDADGPLDVPRIVHALAELRRLPELPREASATLRLGVQLLVDGGLGMAPFRLDVEHLLREIARLLPRDRVRTYHFTGSPRRKCVADGADVLKPWSPPAGGTPVFIVGDLGIGTPVTGDDRAGIAEWLEFAESVHGAGCPLVALVPYGPDRWPRALARAIRIIHWDRRASAAAVRRSVLQATRGMP